MVDRRRFVFAVPALGAATAVRAAPPDAAALTPAECAVFTPQRQRGTSPGEALRLLTEGNERFVAGRTVNGDPRAQVRATESGQAPFASRSEVIRTLVARRELRVVAAMHDVGTGRVTFLG